MTFLLLGIILGMSAVQSSQPRQSYRAAVVEYKYEKLSSPQLSLEKNLENMGVIIKDAVLETVDILVFPEGGIMASDPIYVAVPSPDEKVVPATNNDSPELLKRISQWAINGKMYIAVNVHENYTDPSSKISKKYNTNVVFDRNGAVIARYRKYNLYGEKLDVTSEPEYSYFDTDFGVRMGQFICFDILFQEPALSLINKFNVTDIIFASRWFSELPFLMSLQTQWMWAMGNNVNLLASGFNEPLRGSGGSGIYQGRASGPSWYQMNEQSGSSLLIADVPIGGSVHNSYNKVVSYDKTNSTMHLLVQPEVPEFASEYVNLSLSTRDEANATWTFSKQICHHSLCCSFNLTMYFDVSAEQQTTRHYRVVAFDGLRKFGIAENKGDVQICGVISCLNSSLTSCGILEVNKAHFKERLPHQVTFKSISVSGNFVKKNANVLPNIFLYPVVNDSSFMYNFFPQVDQFKLDSSNSITHLQLNANRTIITCGIHSRVFSRDSDTSGSGPKSAFSFTFVTLFFAFAVLLFKR